jgi:hypothetical protein
MSPPGLDPTLAIENTRAALPAQLAPQSTRSTGSGINALAVRAWPRVAARNEPRTHDTRRRRGGQG